MYVRTTRVPSDDPSRCEYWGEAFLGALVAVCGFLSVLAGIGFLPAAIADRGDLPAAMMAFIGFISIVLIAMGIWLIDETTDLLKGPKARLKNALRCDEKMAFTD